MPRRHDVVVHQCTPQGYKQIVLFPSFQQRLGARVTVQLHCGWWCLAIPQLEDRYCYSINILFPNRPFILASLRWDFHVHEFQCNYISITLHVNKLEGEKQRRKMPSLQFLDQETLSVSSWPFCCFFNYYLLTIKAKVLLSQAETFWHTVKTARDENMTLIWEEQSCFPQAPVSWPCVPCAAVITRSQEGQQVDSVGDYHLGGGFVCGQGTEPTHLSAEEQGDGRKGLFLSMMCAVAFDEVQCQTILSVCSHWGDIHLASASCSIFQNGISLFLREVHCLMDPIFLPSALSFLSAVSIGNKYLSLLERGTCLKPRSAPFHWNSAKPWLENLCEGQRLVREHLTTDVGQGLPAFVRELEDAAVWRGYLVIQFHIAVVVHRNALIVAGGSLCAELTAGSSLYRALGVMMFETCEYKITLSSSSISWEGRKKQTGEKIGCSVLPPYHSL